jgi:ectoine hydrolase
LPAFADAEYTDRIAKTRAEMARRGLDVMLVVDPANMYYLTGYDAWSFYVPQAVVVHVDESQAPLWVGRGMDAPSAVITTNLPRENILSYADDYVESTTKHPMQYVAQVLAERGWGRARIGYESDAYYFSAKFLEVLRASLPEASFVDAYLLVSWIRTVKSESEIEVMRQAARILERVMKVAVDAVNVGTRECDAAAAIAQAQIAGTPEYGGDAPALYPAILSGEKAGTPHSSWSDQPFRAGTATCLELSGCRLRYHCAMSRTVYLGRPPEDMVRLADVTREGLEAALAAVQPGAECQEVAAAWNQVIGRAGFNKASRIGYSIGVNYPPNWADHTASLRAGDTTIMVPNMTFHLMLGMWMEGWGYELSETFRVTPDGHELFAEFPQQLFVK